MKPLAIPRSQACKVILRAAGLAKNEQFGTGREAVSRVVEHLGFIQLDTNYVVERAHNLSMAARIPGYESSWLSELNEDGQIFEYLSFDATGYLPTCDFRFSLPIKESFASNHHLLPSAETLLMKRVLHRVEREGPLKITDFEQDGGEVSSSWGRWRPAKVALERLYLEGKLGVTRDKNFHKVYDLAMNLIPADTDLSMPTAGEYARFVIRRTLGALGIASLKEMVWRTYFLKNNLVKQELAKMVMEGELNTVLVEGLKCAPLYILPDQAIEIDLSNDVFILSPFDIMNVFRYRLRDFFRFDYQIECYVAAAKRKYGYFSLPVLAGDTFIARIDAKADRKQKLLVVHNLHFEPVGSNGIMIEKLTAALKAFALFNQCRDITFTRSNEQRYMDAISRHFR